MVYRTRFSTGLHRTRINFIALVAGVALAGVGGAAAQEGDRYDFVIVNGRVIDPESGLDEMRNLGVRGGRIVTVTEGPLQGKTTLDAKGHVVAPGFIDLHSHGQSLPAARMQAFDGVTTALELEAGVSSIGRYYDAVATEGRPINYGASASWAAARYIVRTGLSIDSTPQHVDEILGSDDWTLPLDDSQEIARMLAYLEDGLGDGALGIGVLLGYAPDTTRKEYYAINELAAREDVPVFTHVRRSSAMEPNSAFEAHQEIVATAAGTGSHIHIAHLNSTSLRDISAIAKLIHGAQQQGLSITVEAYPYAAASTAIGSAFFRGPDWQERLGGVRYEDFTVDGNQLDEESFLKLQTDRPETIIVFRYLRPDINPMDQDYLDRSVLYTGGAIASDCVWWTSKGRRIEGNVWPMPADAQAHPRSAGTFSRLLRVYVRERRILGLKEAIEKASLIPAKILEKSVPQMRKKGRIQPGMDADIVVFDPRTITDNATFDKPATVSSGMRYVIVNGVLVINEGRLVRAALPGQPIRRN